MKEGRAKANASRCRRDRQRRRTSSCLAAGRIIVLLVFMTSGSGCSLFGQDDRISFRAVVLDSESGFPVEGIPVEVTQSGYKKPFAFFQTKEYATMGTVPTDVDGIALITGIRSGLNSVKYTIQVNSHYLPDRGRLDYETRTFVTTDSWSETVLLQKLQ